MLPFARRFDSYLSSINADVIKPMSRIWGGKGLTRKADCIGAIQNGLANPLKVRSAIRDLKPYEHHALALIKQAGGEIDYNAMALGLLASGASIPHVFFRGYRGVSESLANGLIKRGLILSASRYSRGEISSYAHSAEEKIVFSDPRLLDAVGPIKAYTPFAIKSIPPPSDATFRPPQVVALEIVGFLQAIENMGGLGITRQGNLRVNDIKKVGKAMKWPSKTLKMDGLQFDDALNGMVAALRKTDWMQLTEKGVQLRMPAAQIGALSYQEQITALFNGFLRAAEWREPIAESFTYSFSSNHQIARFILANALKSLPLDEDGFFKIDNFDQALFDRVGEHFGLRNNPHPPSPYNKTQEELAQEKSDWLRKLRGEWRQRERLWLADVLGGWLYFLGMVEAGMAKKQLASFRLTPLGKAVLHPEHAQADIQTAETTGAETTSTNTDLWVVQPNMEIIAYLNRLSPPQLAFLEAHAERIDAQQHTAQYRLTRASVYGGLESGSSLEGILRELETGSSVPLPQNVIVEIREWATLRDQIALHRRAHLIEFPDTETRQLALSNGATGTAVGDRFLLVSSATKPASQVPQGQGLRIKQINYQTSIPKNLTVTEDGRLTLNLKQIDLLIESQLDQWAERIDSGQWQLTQKSVTAATKAGLRLKELLSLFEERLTRDVPPLLELALKNWTGKAKVVALETVTVLRCHDQAAWNAILSSELLQSYLVGRLAEGLLVVETERLDEFQKQLVWAGIVVENGVLGFRG
ncbi:helicase-associated domain-containing protein [Chloroflexi bacterium TSY]|nr:helicase-associated domain-containing protein [Chloroflexi bacterium TSY]